MTPGTLESYQRVFKVKFSLYEISLIFKMKRWAEEEKRDLEKEVANE